MCVCACLCCVCVSAVHDGTLPFTGSVVSYKSSTTESSGMEGAEEDTISCKVEVGCSSSYRGGWNTGRQLQPSKDNTSQHAQLSARSPCVDVNVLIAAECWPSTVKTLVAAVNV